MNRYTWLKDKFTAPRMKRWGQAITLTKPGTDTFDAVTGVLTPGTPVEHDGYAIEKAYTIEEMDGTLVQQNDRRLLCAGIPKPTPTEDTLTIDSADYTVIKVNPFSPGGTAVFYEVQIR